MRRRSPNVFGVVLVACGLAVAITVAIVWWQQRDRVNLLGRSPTPVATGSGAFENGGVPSAHVGHTRSLLCDGLAAVVVSANEVDERRDEKSLAALAQTLDTFHGDSQRVPPALGSAAQRVADRVVDTALSSGILTDLAADSLGAATAALNSALWQADIGLYLDSNVVSHDGESTPTVLLFCFNVESVSRYRTDGGPVYRTLQLRRADRLNWSYSLLGYAAPQEEMAAVLLGQIEGEVVRSVLPAATRGTSSRLLGIDSVDDRNVDMVNAVVTAVGEDLGVLAPPEHVAELSRLLDSRARSIKAWNVGLRERGVELKFPSTLVAGTALQRSIAAFVGEDEEARFVELDAALAQPPLRSAHARVVSALITSVEHHEVQHRIDERNERGPSQRLGELLAAASDDLRQRADAELSAYLAEIARADKLARVRAFHVAAFLFDENYLGSAESYAGAAMLEGIDKVLSGQPGGPVIRNRQVDQARLRDIVARIAASKPQAVALAARRTWRAQFGDDLIDLAYESD